MSYRHSESKSATVRLSRDPQDKSIRVEVRDRGKGIAGGRTHPSGPAKPGIGIQGMRERIRQLGGQLDVQSAGDGTLVFASFRHLIPTKHVRKYGSPADEKFFSAL